MHRSFTGLSVIAIAVASLTFAEDPPSRQPLGCIRLDVRTISDADIEPPRSRTPRFSAGDTLDLELAVRYLSSDHRPEVFEIRLFTPNGHLYQALVVPTARQSDVGKQALWLPDHPFPVAAEVPTVVSTGPPRVLEVTTRWPLAGTAVTTHSLYGRWRAEARTPGRPAACASAQFTLTQ